MIKKLVKDYFFGRARYQPFWERLHSWAIQGMNISSGDGSIDPGEIWVLKYVNERIQNESRPVVLDVGANEGLYSAEVVRQFPDSVRLYAFEPAHDTYEVLKQRLSTAKNVQCLNFGFSDREEAVTLYSWAGGSGMSSVYDRFFLNRTEPNGDHAFKKEEKISLRTIDSFCTENGINRVALLKLDVEGHELKVLHGATGLIRSGAIDFIQFEFGGTNVDSRTFLHDFVDLLRPRYSLYRILKDGLISVEPYNERNEILLYSNYLAVAKDLETSLKR